jgi:hypothetical protein
MESDLNHWYKRYFKAHSILICCRGELYIISGVFGIARNRIRFSKMCRLFFIG